MVLDLLKIGLVENLTEDSNIKEESNKVEKSTKILYNKKLLLIVAVVILAVILYIYYYDVSITLPIVGSLSTCNLFNKKKNKNNNKNTNEFEEFSNDDESENIDGWNLEIEIKNYMEKQHEYISNNIS